MKKVLLLFLVVIMVFSLFVGCAEDSTGSIDKTGSVKPTTSTESTEKPGHTDNSVNIAEPIPEHRLNFLNTQIGEYIKFGKYEQDNEESNGKEDIEWLVLDKKEGHLLVISKYALDCKDYNKVWHYDVTWETSYVRMWLNNEFVDSAFNSEEKAMIPTVEVSADENPEYTLVTDPGNETQDKVFLLSIPEADKYFSSDSERQCKPTEYAIANEAFTSSRFDGNGPWLLRSPGRSQEFAASVDSDGTIDEFGIGAPYNWYAVRPAMWICVDESATTIERVPELDLNFSNVEIGEYVKFGKYEQDNNKSNGKENIKWLVLDKKDGKILVISKFALDAKLYNTNLEDITWEKCSLRKWLNNEFIANAFTSDEKNIISKSSVVPDSNLDYNKTDYGNETTDKVFLLSIDEAKTYFSSYSARVCKPTAYAEANGAIVNTDNDYCWWWLRSPGATQNCAAYVSGDDGKVLSYGTNVNFSFVAVRPAMWIDLNS